MKRKNVLREHMTSVYYNIAKQSNQPNHNAFEAVRFSHPLRDGIMSLHSWTFDKCAIYKQKTSVSPAHRTQLCQVCVAGIEATLGDEHVASSLRADNLMPWCRSHRATFWYYFPSTTTSFGLYTLLQETQILFLHCSFLTSKTIWEVSTFWSISSRRIRCKVRCIGYSP